MIIGLTGGIAGGKTTVAGLFKEKGALVLDADKIAHRVIKPGRPAYKKIVRYFGPEILNKNRSVNRRRLAGIVFSSPRKLKKLNGFVHPEVIKIILAQVKKWKKKRIIVIDAPLLIEAGLHKKVDKLVVITCSRPVQMKRLLKEKGLSKKEAGLRISSQMPLKDKIKLADELIDGELSLNKLRVEVNRLCQE
jgi:dephospho-CoA kinase